MKAVLLASFFASSAVAGEPAAPAGPGGQKGLSIQRREDCMNAATFDSFLYAGADSWGVEEGKAKAGVDLLEAAVQCRAWASASDEPCRSLGMVPRFAAGKHLAANCRSEHHLLVFYDAVARKDSAVAERACGAWYAANKDQMLTKVKGEQLCGRLVALLLADPASACKALGKEMAQAAGDAAERAAVESTCAGVWTPSKASCDRADWLPFEKRRCGDYAKLRVALTSRKPADCPASPRYQGLCRAMLDKNPAAACEAPRKAWQELLCAGRFQER